MTPPGGPQVSVVIPTFNRRELVLRAVRSVLDQETAAAVEVIVVDDGSTDATAQALLAAHAGDARVCLIAGERRHASAARNTGFAAARGDFVCFLDSDDYWLPGTLGVFAAGFARFPELAFVSVDGATIATRGQAPLQRVVAGDSPGWRHPRFAQAHLAATTIQLPDATIAPVVHGDFFPAIVNGDLFYLSGLLMRRASAAAAGPFNERFRYFNDWEFFSRLCLAGSGAYIAHDGFRRDSGRADQISRRRPASALARRQLFLLRTAQRRAAVAAAYGDALGAALGDAQYRLAHCLWRAGQSRRARKYLYNCIKMRHRIGHCLLRIGASFLPRLSRPDDSGW